jgi:hypothetical protein
VQITLEIPDPTNTEQSRTVTVAMDQTPEPGDQIILADSYGSTAYRVRRQSWHIDVRREIYGEVSAHRVQLEPEVPAQPEAPASAAKARRTKPAS